MRTVLPRLISLAAIGAAGAFYLVWEIAHRGVFRYATIIYPVDDADEWRYTACSKLVARGYPLFSQVFSAQPPLLFLSLAGSMRVFGETITGARGVEIASGLISLGCVAWIAWRMSGPVAGAVSAVLLAVSPGFLVYSHAVEAEGPMMALTTLSIALALQYRSKVSVRWAPLAGLVLAAAVLMKLFAVAGALPILWLLSAERERVKGWWRAPAVFLVALVIPVVLDFTLVSPGDQWRQVIALHNAAAGATLAGAPSSLHVLKDFFALDPGLSVLALAGLILLGVVRRWVDLVFLLLWLIGGAVMLLLFRPLFPHHPAILLDALAVPSGIGFWLGACQMANHRRLQSAPLALALTLYVLAAPALAHADRHLLVPGLAPDIETLAGYVQAHSAATDFVAADDLAVTDQANRLVPPPLCDPSVVRLKAGYLRPADLIGATRRYHAVLVVPSFGIYDQVPAYIRWLQGHYQPVLGPGDRIFYRISAR